MITDFDQLDLTQRYTYADYLTWRFEETVELIRGKIFRMAPAPSLHHQRVAGRIHGELYTFFRKNNCDLFIAPFDVRLPLPPDQVESDRVDTVVQPDLCVVCDPEKLDARGCKGAPDWVLEVLSPATSSKDLNEKFEVYQHAGVKEYWVVHPYDGTVVAFFLDKSGTYQTHQTQPYSADEVVSPRIFPDIKLDLGRVFDS